MSTAAIVIVVVAVILLALVGFMVMRQIRTRRLRDRFGPEYEREVRESGSAARAERQLQQREERVKKYKILPLTAADRARFVQSWAEVQAHFVDSPKGAVTEADQIVAEVMKVRGYPVADFETCAADLSVDHPRVVENYRAGHAIAEQHARGEASTEDLRRAMVHYRTLFQDLVGENLSARAVGA